MNTRKTRIPRNKKLLRDILARLDHYGLDDIEIIVAKYKVSHPLTRPTGENQSASHAKASQHNYQWLVRSRSTQALA
ncbi:MAG: hypothetical protein LBU79_06445 [Planctomycetota bacterium]|jgi:hypothetical protein|nr:hypothetical protein [Planctomycetota bacterium]